MKKDIYTHKMLEDYINMNSAVDEAYNYVDAGMNDEEIRADAEECLKNIEFEIPEDREIYISLVLAAAADLREERYDN